MKETEYKLDLGKWWDDCPTMWQNFINDLRLNQHGDNYVHLSEKDIDKALEPYHAYRCHIVHAIYFAEEKYKNWFMLKWS